MVAFEVVLVVGVLVVVVEVLVVVVGILLTATETALLLAQVYELSPGHVAIS